MYEELKKLAEAFPADLDWDSNTEPFFNGPSGESLGGGATGFYSVYGKPFRLEGEDYDYDGPTYVESCNADFAKFMVAARDGVLALIAENEALGDWKALAVDRQRQILELTVDIGRFKSENEALRNVMQDVWCISPGQPGCGDISRTQRTFADVDRVWREINKDDDQ